MPYVGYPLSVRRLRSAPLHRALAVLVALLQGAFGLAVGPRAAGATSTTLAGRPAPAGRPAVQIDRGDFGEGLDVALVVSQELGLEDDETALARLYDIGSRISLAADDPSTVITFYVVKIPEPNAFAVPGGSCS